MPIKPSLSPGAAFRSRLAASYPGMRGDQRRNIVAMADEAFRQAVYLAQQMELVNELREEEGSSVNLVADNADFEGPECLVECVGRWTDWQERRFTGATRLEALTKAAEAYRSHQSEDLRVPGGYRGPTSVPTLPPVGGSSIMPPPKRRWRFWR